jgi:hypothetical protein
MLKSSKVEESYITFSKNGTQSYVGPDATEYYRAKVLLSGLGLLKKGLRINKYATPKQLLKMAGKYSGKTYKQRQYDEAIHDVTVWLQAMALALPMVEIEDRTGTPCLK